MHVGVSTTNLMHKLIRRFALPCLQLGAAAPAVPPRCCRAVNGIFELSPGLPLQLILRHHRCYRQSLFQPGLLSGLQVFQQLLQLALLLLFLGQLLVLLPDLHPALLVSKGRHAHGHAVLDQGTEGPRHVGVGQFQCSFSMLCSARASAGFWGIMSSIRLSMLRWKVKHGCCCCATACSCTGGGCTSTAAARTNSADTVRLV